MNGLLAGEILTVMGYPELTAANEEALRVQIAARLNGHVCIDIDLRQTTFMDCAGLGALIAVRSLVRERRGMVRLLVPVPAVRRLLELTCTTELFEIVDSHEPVA